MFFYGCLPFLIFFGLLILLPVLFGHILASALLKLHLEPGVALLLALGMLIGGGINLPIWRIPRTEPVPVHPLSILGMADFWPHLMRVRYETVIAVNVGGCLIPGALAIYEFFHLILGGWSAVGSVLLASGINTWVCYRLARPLPNVGIVMPALIPPLVAATCAVLLLPGNAPPVAFIAGVMGPLLGADLLHLREIPRISTGMASIGGAGTFDGIVLSGIIAVYLA